MPTTQRARSFGDILELPDAAEQLRLHRPEVEAHAEAGVSALFEEPQRLPATVLHALAARVARRQGSGPLFDHHASRALVDPDASALLADELPRDDRLRALVEHVDLITVSPALVDRDDQLVLPLSGITADDVVLISQVVALTSYRVRAAHGFQLLADQEPSAIAGYERATVARGRAHRVPDRTTSGRPAPTAFTREVLQWEPWVPPVPEDELTELQAASFAAKATRNSVYFRLLARVPGVLRARSALDNAVFQGEGGLPIGERELAAAVASKVNDCIYCASVHARKAVHQTKRADDIDRLLAVRLERDGDWLASDVDRLADGQDARWSAIIRFAARLSTLVPTATADDLAELRAVGLDDLQVADLVHATAFFAWANRLMLSLGEPALPDA